MRALRIPLVVVALLLAGCATQQAAWVELAGHRYQVELATDPASRERGLMFRDALPSDHGMLFIHDHLQPQAYWMKNTKIPLDILYFDDQRRLVKQQRNVPPCSAGNACPAYPSTAPARYVLELNAGQADALALRDGTEMVLSPRIPTPNP